MSIMSEIKSIFRSERKIAPKYIFLLTGVCLAGIWLWFQTAADVPAPLPAVKAPLSASTAAPPVPVVPVKNYGNWEEIKDPFLQQNANRPETLLAGPAAAASGGKTPAEPLPILTGIVIGTEPVAIIRWGGKSKSYQLRERVGEYIVTAIEPQSVTLQGPAGSRTLQVGR